MRGAGVALLHGVSIYSDPTMVYPPTAAVAFLPLSLGRYVAALNVWIVLSAIAVASAGLLSAAPWRRGIWLLLSALAAGVMVKSDALTYTLALGNLSLLLAPVAVGVLLLFEAGRWRTGCALLVFSLLLKPMLLPLILLPLLRRKWRPVLEAWIGACILLAIAIVLVPGGAHSFSVFWHIEASGTNTGRHAVYDISIRGVAERLGVDTWGSAARAAVVALAATLACVWARQASRPGSVAGIGTLLLLATFLAGSVSEVHYLLVAVPCLLTTIAFRRSLSGVAAALPGLFLFAFPDSYIGNVANSPQAVQIRFFLAELLLFIATAVSVAQSSRSDASTRGEKPPLGGRLLPVRERAPAAAVGRR
ncbi:MAG: glycosyltransferase family 87 protein [Solirubrobacteraceae bacterium]